MPRQPGVETGAFADVRVYFVSSWSNTKIVERLNNQLTFTSGWCKKWRIKINATKSESILFVYQLKNRDINPPEFDNTPIAWKNQVKYLGVTLDHRLK